DIAVMAANQPNLSALRNVPQTDGVLHIRTGGQGLAVRREGERTRGSLVALESQSGLSGRQVHQIEGDAASAHHERAAIRRDSAYETRMLPLTHLLAGRQVPQPLRTRVLGSHELLTIRRERGPVDHRLRALQLADGPAGHSVIDHQKWLELSRAWRQL